MMEKERIEFQGEMQDGIITEKGRYSVGTQFRTYFSPDREVVPILEVMTYWEKPDGDAVVYVGREGCAGVDLEQYRYWEELLPLFRERLQEIELLIFDVDGTLTPKNNPELDAEYQTALARLGSSFLSEDEDKLRELIKNKFLEGESASNFLQSLGVTRELIADAYSSVDKAQFLERDLVLLAMFETLEDKDKAIITSSPRKENEGALRVLGLEQEYFRPIICLEDVARSKPEPEMFEKAIDLSGVPAEQCVFIGDSLKKDVRGAGGVGMRTILVGEESDEATVWIPRIYDLPRLFV